MVSIVLVILGRDSTTMKRASEGMCEVNKNFLKKIIKKEKQMDKFTKKFYNVTLSLPYSNDHRICKIRELDIKQEEAEEDQTVYKEEESIYKKEES